MRKLKLKILISIALTSLCGLIPTAEAQQQILPTGILPVFVAGLSNPVLTAIFLAQSNSLAKLYNQALTTYANLVYEFDPAMPATIATNQTLKTYQDAANNDVKTASANNIQQAFAGLREKNLNKIKLELLPAGDDVLVNTTPPVGLFGSILGTQDSSSNNTLAQKGNVMFDVESLIWPEAYDANQDKAARAFIQQITQNYGQTPTPIRLGATFDVSMINVNDPTKTTVTIGDTQPLTPTEINNLRVALQSKPEYRQYRNDYRGIIAAASVYNDNLLYAYNQRVPRSDGRSALQVRNDLINQRLTPAYYKTISTASPATVQREILATLVVLTQQLQTMNELEERRLIMDSITGLGNISLSAKTLNVEAMNVGLDTYCLAPGNANKTECTTSTSTVDVSKMQSQLMGTSS